MNEQTRRPWKGVEGLQRLPSVLGCLQGPGSSLQSPEGLASAESHGITFTGQGPGSATAHHCPSSSQGCFTSLILNKTQGADTFL